MPDRFADGGTLFVSDVHLSEARPKTAEAFFGFLAGPARRARALYILGDLFDLWLGDDDERPPHAETVEALRALADSGVELFFSRGNHDFLVGPRMLERAGCRLLEEAHVIQVEGERVVVMHGDTLCTRDVDYQEFRKVARNPEVQGQFLAMPFSMRLERASALWLRARELVQLKPADIMDVTEDAVVETLDAHAVRWMVHGHTHRPAFHTVQVNGGEATRIVLGDWYEQDSVLAWDGAGPRLMRVGELG